MTLAIRNLELCRHDEVGLLGPLDLDLAPGARLALLGESGSGKSLLAQAILGLLPPGVRQTQGSVEAFGCRMDLASPERDRIRGRRLAWITQDPLAALNPLVRLEDQVTLLPKVQRGECHRLALARLLPLLERLGLPVEAAFLRRYPLEISGGQRQRIALAMALSSDPELMILDEPTSALDSVHQAEFLALMDGLRRERALGWLWITHNLEVAATVADQVLVLYGGQALEAGPSAQILKNPRHPYTRRLCQAHLSDPAQEAGFLDAPGHRAVGCPYQPRCPQRQVGCARWQPWQGHSGAGLRCEAIR